MKTIIEYPNHLNPEFLHMCIVGERTVEFKKDVPFNILDWVSSDIKKYFSDEVILKAIRDENIVFNMMYKIHTCSDLRGFTHFPKVHHINRIEKKQKTVKMNNNRWSESELKKYDEYYLYVPSELINGKLLSRILRNVYSFLNKEIYYIPTEKEVNVHDWFNSYIRLTEIPEGFRDYSVNELLQMKEDKVKVIDNIFMLKCYSDIKEMYLSINSIQGFPSLMINLESFLKGDFDSIENRTKVYYSDYYKNKPEYLKMINELFESDVIKELKKDMGNI